MNDFSFSHQVPLKTPTGDPGFAEKLAGLSSKPSLRDITTALNRIYEKADTLSSHRIACRRCAGCCRHRLVQAYAVEIAYLMSAPSDAPAEPMTATDEPCPALDEANSCSRYERRPLACRVFQPWSRWTILKGCANYPENRASAGELSAVLNALANLNQAFVHRTGLHRDLDFDYLGQWSMTDWFPS